LAETPASIVAVRRLVAADAAAFRDIRLAGLADDPRAFTADWATEAAHDLGFFEARLTTNDVFAAPGAPGALFGVAGLTIPANPKQRHRGHIWGVYVRPVARGRGIGAALLAAAVGAARGRVESISLGVGTYNDAAIRAYRAAGFVQTGLEARALRIGDDYIDEMTMTLRLE
jgi:ribosomal protein S18 acetylase RimI-like enzyme